MLSMLLDTYLGNQMGLEMVDKVSQLLEGILSVNQAFHDTKSGI